MPILTPGQIVDALARNEANRLVGALETEQVDFKLAPYMLTENHQKWELAKDVAAFANKNSHAKPQTRKVIAKFGDPLFNCLNAFFESV